jgi:hypothetical protein
MKTATRLAASLCACALLLAAADGAQRKDDARHADSHAVVAGTVFRESGFSLPGATVTLAVKDAPKVKKLQAVSDPRGEFAFRVPPGPGTYVVRAAMKGFQPVEKEASVSGEERVEVTLELPAESK